MSTKILLALVGALVAGSSYGADEDKATELKFNWTSNSASDRMFICNTGILHSSGRTGDKISVKYQFFGEHFGLFLEQSKTIGASGSHFEELGENIAPLKTKINELTITLKSQKYGSRYFVDFCYHGPTYDAAKSGITEEFFLSRNNLTYTDHRASETDRHYFSDAKVSATSLTVCDTQVIGRHTGPRTFMESDVASLSLQRKSGDWVIDRNKILLSKATQTIQWGSGDHSKANSLNAAVPYAVPRYCITRYEISEGSTGNRNEELSGGKFLADTVVTSE